MTKQGRSTVRIRINRSGSKKSNLDFLYRCVSDSIISALHKSMRGSDVQASLYWMARMLEGGEDPTYVARRLIRFASEDVGLADPNALVQAVSGFQAVQFIGMPECNVILAQVAAYLARAPKSNKLYEAYNAVQADIKNKPLYPVPLHLRNAPTKMMADLGFSKGYKYNPDHKYEGDIQDYLPPELKGANWFQDDVADRTTDG
jgi:putative ATPase